MRNFGLLIVFFLGLQLQADTLKPIDISSIRGSRHLAPHALILEDKEQQYTLSQVLSQEDSLHYFQSNSPVPYMDFTTSTYWMKLKVINRAEDERLYYIELARPLTNFVELYIYDENQNLVEQFSAGDEYFFCSREYEHRNYIFPVEFPPGEARLLMIKTSSDGEILKLPIRFWEVNQFTEFTAQENFFLGFYYGLFCLVIILFSFFGLALRQKLYLNFVIYVFSLALFQFSLDGLAFQYLWRGVPWLANHAILIFAATSMLAMLLYVRRFLDFNRTFPRYNIGYNIFLGLFCIFLITSFLQGPLYAITFPILNGLSFIAVLYIIFGIYLKYKHENKVELPVLLAFIALTISSILFILSNVNYIKSEFLATNALKLGSATEVIFLSIAMAGRYRRTQAEKIQAQEEAFIRLKEINTLKNQQTERLEKEVAERTKEILEKNDILETKNKEIINSINYAQRLQEAILPSAGQLIRALPESAVLFMPKDIVSGDFYWMQETRDRVYFAVADCTGHGVPGAMLSVLGHNSLNRCIKEFNLTDAGAILDKLTELVTEAFSNEKTSVSDGMDISLCIWGKADKLQFAGAFNPLYLIREGELTEIKGNKQPIGKFEQREAFTTHELSLQKGDSVFLFSDGYADQFGGPKGKKYRYGKFKSLLQSTLDLPITQVEDRLNKEILEWKGELEQIDDICVLNVRF
jgi:serine phosphatase RsbU (regulator of sigma subunit)